MEYLGNANVLCFRWVELHHRFIRSPEQILYCAHFFPGWQSLGVRKDADANMLPCAKTIKCMAFAAGYHVQHSTIYAHSKVPIRRSWFT